MLGESSADEDGPADAPSGQPSSRRKLVLRKSRALDAGSTKALDSEGIEWILNLESSLRQCRGDGEEQGGIEEYVGRALIGEVGRQTTYTIDVAEAGVSPWHQGL